VRVKAVSPVSVVRPPIPSLLEELRVVTHRAGQPEKVARVIAVLCSDVASFIDGTNVKVDFGAVASI
jgi:NAD(P)-dependent dehydrogenase (short-subunit alcohol dehydrogenase family)